MQLDIYSDIVCPWCYLGHRRLSAAIGRLGAEGEPIRLRWRAFQLDPTATAQPKDLCVSIDRKYGPGAFDSMTQRLVGLGAPEGIEFRFESALRVGTFDAHRLLQWTQATTPDRTDALADRLFRAYFTEGANIADHEVLEGLAEDAGLDRVTAGDVLGSEDFADVVRSDVADAAQVGVTGVPAVAYNGAVLIPGAQAVEDMEAVLRRLLARAG